MQKNIKIIISLLVLISLIILFSLLSKTNNQSIENHSFNSLNQEEIKWLVFMREEEKLARDVYKTLGDKWGLPIFSNISSSEQTHTDAVKNLLNKYNVSDPVVDDEIGVFQSEILQKLYFDLVNEGNLSLDQALKVGAEIEDLDINDLDLAMKQTNEQDILQVYANLQKGSRNHLRSFVRQIESRSGKYIPKYISIENYNSIISNGQERGQYLNN